MTTWKALSFLFVFFTFGGLRETVSIMNDPQYAGMQRSLVPMALGITCLFGFIALWFWKKHLKYKDGL